jgi:hypothetical protein
MKLIVLGLPFLVAFAGLVLTIPKSTRMAGYILLGLGALGVASGAVLIAIVHARSSM